MTNIFFKISVKKVYLRVTTRTDDVSALHHALKNCGELYNMSKFHRHIITLDWRLLFNALLPSVFPNSLHNS